MWAQPGQGHVCGQRLVARTGEGGSGQLEDETLRQFLNLPSETREDRTKRLFRHYTVGSYDSLSAHRYRRGGWAGGRWGQMRGRPRGEQSAGRSGAQPTHLLPPRSVQGRLPERALPTDPVWGTCGVSLI